MLLLRRLPSHESCWCRCKSSRSSSCKSIRQANKLSKLHQQDTTSPTRHDLAVPPPTYLLAYHLATPHLSLIFLHRRLTPLFHLPASSTPTQR